MSSERDAEIRRHRQYLQAINRQPILDADEEANLVRRWTQEKDPSAKEGLIRSHLRIVPSIAQRTADEFGYKPSAESSQHAWDGYFNVCTELVIAGNEGLLAALGRFDASRGRFAACARWSIRKACWAEAKWLRSPVKHPKRVRTPWSLSIELSEDNEVPSMPFDSVAWPATDNIIELGDLLAARADLLENPRERHIIRLRYLTQPEATLKRLANEFGISPGRVHQIEQRAVGSLVDMVAAAGLEELADFYLSNCPVTAFMVGNGLHCPIDDWLDALKLLFPSATQSDRIRAHRLADQRRSEASDFNLKRVQLAFEDRLTAEQIANDLALPLEAVEHLRQLAGWRCETEARYVVTEAGRELIEQAEGARDAA